MSQRQPGRSKDEWMELITQCRQSGLSDSMWCEQQGIPASTFYNAVTRLRKRSAFDHGGKRDCEQCGLSGRTTGNMHGYNFFCFPAGMVPERTLPHNG